MHGDPLAILEIGSHSLKLHVVRRSPEGDHRIETKKIPWRVAHYVFAHGCIGESTAAEVATAIRDAIASIEGVPPSRFLAVATGVFREFPGLDRLAQRVNGDVGIRVRVTGPAR